ncbi:TolC family protein [Acidipila sp. EB88]|uniref:TolC family protein n=1 Tax=Acidipila sp. EB88 TaxID=2305226 RepID=UPI001F21A321|nr:TolC family protein [Acidipila sp. EB88]
MLDARGVIGLAFLGIAMCNVPALPAGAQASGANNASGATGQQGKTPPPAPSTDNTTAGLPTEPRPNPTQPLFMRPDDRDFQRPRGYFPHPFAPYTATTTTPPRFTNTTRLNDLIRNGRLFLSLSDAVALTLENNFDIAIQRYNLDIADTDLLRARSGATLLGVNAGLVTGTIGTATASLSSGGGPGGTSVSSGGAAAGASGLALSTNQGGPLPEQLDPVLTGLVELQRSFTPELNTVFTGTDRLNQNENQYNFTYTQGFLTGTQAQFSWNNNYITQNSPFQTYSPATQSVFNLQLTQHLLRGFGTGINGRFIVQAKNNRRVSDSAFRQQVLYTVNQVENIYWGLVSAYEDVQAKQGALDQSSRLAADDQRQLEIGTLAPLDVVNARSAAASDQQALVAAKNTLEYQQLVMKQAISRNLEDPAFSSAPVVPTDRVNLAETPEETMPVDDLVRQAEANRPEIEQALLALKNDEITLKGEKNGLLPTLDAFAFYGGSGIGGQVNPLCASAQAAAFGISCAGLPQVGYGDVFQNTFNNSSPNKGAGLSLTVPLRNRQAQSEQARSVLEYRQEQMRLEQLYVQVRMQVINSQYALRNDRAQVASADAAREYAAESLKAESRKLELGASTTASVLQQERNMATAQDNFINARATYAKDRAALDNILADTLDKYGISLGDAVTGTVTQMPRIPGLEAATPEQQAPASLAPAQPRVGPQPPPGPRP